METHNSRVIDGTREYQFTVYTCGRSLTVWAKGSSAAAFQAFRQCEPEYNGPIERVFPSNRYPRHFRAGLDHIEVHQVGVRV
jgi:hypothetical protein